MDETYSTDIYYAYTALHELSLTNWQGFSDLRSIRTTIRDEALREIFEENIQADEKRRKIYDYIMNMLIKYKEYIQKRELVLRDECTCMLLLIEMLSFHKHKETLEITEKIFEILETLYNK